MANILDYLDWRGDLDFSRDPMNQVDALIFAELSYIPFENVVPESPDAFIGLKEAAEVLFLEHEKAPRLFAREDFQLLKKTAGTKRFGTCAIGYYQDVLLPEADTQFAAMTFLLSDGNAVIAYRGTDSTMTGWKEDFNMSFQDTVPAQLFARKYMQEFAKTTTCPIYVTGHSKGGNLAVYAAAKCGKEIQDRIVKVQNNDGPGFHQTMMEDPEYQRILPNICTCVPQSSVIGMLLEHEEPYTVVRSKQVGILQHDAYSWQVLGGGFLCQNEVNQESKIFDRALKKWLAEMTIEERNNFVDAVFDLLEDSGADTTRDLIRPRKLMLLLKNFRSDEQTKKLITGEIANLILTAAKGRLRRDPQDTQTPSV